MKAGSTFVGPVTTGTVAVSDPLASLTAPSTSGMTVQSTKQLVIPDHSTMTLNPGVYVGGIKIGNGDTITLNPGIYYLQGGGFIVNGNSTVSDGGLGVLLYNAPKAARRPDQHRRRRNVTLSAMATGAYQGLSIFQDRNSTNQMVVQGKNTLLTITGSIYAASASLNVTTGADLDFTRSRG